MNKKLLLILGSILIMTLIFGCADNRIEDNDVQENIEENNQAKENQEEKKEIQEKSGQIQKEKEETSNNEETEEKEENEGEAKVGIFAGDKAPDFTIIDREGNEITLSQFKGKAIFLNFWASWCPPCVAEMPAIQNTYEKYKDKDVVILAVNVTAAEKNGERDTNKFLEQNNYTFPVLLDIEGEAAGKYGIRYFPTSYFINKDGVIVNNVVGGMTEEMMIENIEKAME